jgi:hypothetical protein
MHNLDLYAIQTIARIDAERQPARLERIRQQREALAVTHQRPFLVRQLGRRLSQAGIWLQGPPVIAPDPVAVRSG